MQENKKAYALVLLVSTSLGALGQVFFKIGVTSHAVLLISAYLSMGILSYLASTVVYFYVLSRTHLSWAYGFTGLSYIFASLIAFFFLGESVPVLRWIGIITIAIGTALIGIS
ncbi:MAG: EamA family transporter [Candidatus Micrarchaeaceae archaeon]